MVWPSDPVSQAEFEGITGWWLFVESANFFISILLWTVGDTVIINLWSGTFAPAQTGYLGTITKVLGPITYIVETGMGHFWKRHADQIKSWIAPVPRDRPLAISEDVSDTDTPLIPENHAPLDSETPATIEPSESYYYRVWWENFWGDQNARSWAGWSFTIVCWGIRSSVPITGMPTTRSISLTFGTVFPSIYDNFYVICSWFFVYLTFKEGGMWYIPISCHLIVFRPF